jgi:transglutaminase-like putative cysteine protease
MVTGFFRWPGWRHLPRETRDVLFLLGVIAWTVLPHLQHLPWWCGALTGVVLLWRAQIALANGKLPSRWAVMAVLSVAMLLTLSTHRTLLGKEAGVTLLVVLMVLKTLELRARRDALVVFFLGFFLVLTNFLYSQSLAVAAAMLVSVWGLLTALVLAHMPVGQPSLRRAGGLAMRAALIGTPAMVLLFLLFPRIGPLWGLPSDAMGATGLSGTLRLGEVAEIAIDDSVALRLRFFGRAPAPETLYLRGPVLTRFDGLEWRRTSERNPFPPPQPELRLAGEPVRYEMTLEPSRLALLPLLEVTPDQPGAAPRAAGWRFFQRSDLQWAVDRPVVDRLRFEAQAWPRHQHGPLERDASLDTALELPLNYNPRTIAWAREFRAQQRGADANGLARALMQHIRSTGFVYTLTPGTYGDERGRHAIDEFWLDRKQGFCEHFATSFVVALRAMNVPARVVTGYQGADPRIEDGYYLVRNSYAHAWAEYWQPGRGWVRADPTAAVAPERVVRSRNLAPERGLVAGTLHAVNPQLMDSLRRSWERLNNRYNQWVLNYSRSDQYELLERMGVRSPTWEDLAYLIIGLASFAALGGAAWAWWDRKRQDPWQRLQSRVRRRLGALGVKCEPHEAPRTLAARVRAELGDAGTALAAELDALDRLRYGHRAVSRPDPAWWRGFVRMAAAAAHGGPRRTG